MAYNPQNQMWRDEVDKTVEEVLKDIIIKVCKFAQDASHTISEEDLAFSVEIPIKTVDKAIISKQVVEDHENRISIETKVSKKLDALLLTNETRDSSSASALTVCPLVLVPDLNLENPVRNLTMEKTAIANQSRNGSLLESNISDMTEGSNYNHADSNQSVSMDLDTFAEENDSGTELDETMISESCLNSMLDTVCFATSDELPSSIRENICSENQIDGQSSEETDEFVNVTPRVTVPLINLIPPDQLNTMGEIDGNQFLSEADEADPIDDNFYDTSEHEEVSGDDEGDVHPVLRISSDNFREPPPINVDSTSSSEPEVMAADRNVIDEGDNENLDEIEDNFFWMMNFFRDFDMVMNEQRGDGDHSTEDPNF